MSAYEKSRSDLGQGVTIATLVAPGEHDDHPDAQVRTDAVAVAQVWLETEGEFVVAGRVVTEWDTETARDNVPIVGEETVDEVLARLVSDLDVAATA